MLSEARRPELPEWLLPLYPFRTRRAQMGPYAMSWVDEGPADAPVLLLLHGNPAWSFLYRHVIKLTSCHFRVIAPDLIGFGLSDKPPADYHTLAQHIANLMRLVELLDLREITLVANGWGGPVGLGYAVANPHNIARLILTNTWGFELPPSKRCKPPLGMRIAAGGRVGAWLDSLLNLTLHSAFPSPALRAMGDLAFEGYCYPFFRSGSRAAQGAFSRMLCEPDPATLAQLHEISAGLKRIEAPASILWGVRDQVLTKLPAYLLRDALPRASEPVFLPEVSHFVPEEAPEAIAKILLEKPQPAEASRPDDIFKIVG